MLKNLDTVFLGAEFNKCLNFSYNARELMKNFELMKKFFDEFNIINYFKESFEIYELKISVGVCSKPFQNSKLAFKCLDCEILNDNQVLCKDCFLNGNHKNHKYFQCDVNEGFCDCGDISALKQSGKLILLIF